MGSPGVGQNSRIENRSSSFAQFRSSWFDIPREFGSIKLRPEQWDQDLDFGDRELGISDMDEPQRQHIYGNGALETTYNSEIGSRSVEFECTPVPGAFPY
jgi:hypothetical protein